MRKQINKYLLFLLIGVTMFSCKKDFLNVAPIGVINSSSFYTLKSDADQAVTAIYSTLDYTQCWDLYLMADLGSIASDDAEAGGNTGDDTYQFQNIDRYIFTPNESTVFTETYGVLYKAIYYANLAIQNLPGIVKTDTTASPTFINQRLGEAKFLRALNFFYLAQIYGEVPLADHVLGATEYGKGRSSLRSIYDLMEKDLNDAITSLPVSWDADNIGRATKGAAQGLLAKVYLFESSYAHNYPGDNYSLVNKGQSRFKDLTEKWSDALAQAEAVINSGQYDLPGINGETYNTWRGPNTDGFRYVWSTAGNNSKESVFEVQCESLNLSWLKTRGSSVVWWTGVRWIIDPKTLKPTESKMWGFNIPSHDLYAEFNKEPGDPRFNSTIHIAGGNDSISGANGWSKICWNYSPTQFVRTGMCPAKYECSYAEYISTGNGWGESPFNIRILRYADVVLIAAEAAIMTGDNAKAMKYINMVRTRARMCGGAGNTVPADLTGTVIIDQLIHERRLELALEGHRFFDMVRWNRAAKDYKADQSGGFNGQPLSGGVSPSTVTFVSPKNDFFPIPQQEINTSKGVLLQYPGW